MSNSIGNLKNSGLQGNNFPWQLKMLIGQECICDQLKLANDILQDIDDNTDQVEPLLVQILTAIQNGTDYEAALVVDSTGATWLEVRIWNGTTFDPPIYFLAGSNTPGTPVAPITYVNPNSYLAQIVSYTSNLVSIESLTSSINTLVTNINTNLSPVLRTPRIATVVNTTGSTPAGAFSFSIANVGSASGLVDGEVLPAGVTINYDGGTLNNTLDTILFDATGTTFVVTWII